MPDNQPGRSRGQRSLFGEILDWMLAPVLLLWPLSVALTWLVAQNIANKPFDRDLGQMAQLMARQITVQPFPGNPPSAAFSLPAGAAEILRTDEDSIYYQVLGLHGEFLSGDRDVPLPPAEDKDSSAAKAGDVLFRRDVIRNSEVQVAYLWLSVPGQGHALVQVAETLGKRSRLATEIIKGVMLPQFVILPLAVLLVWLALSRGIAPLDELQQRIRRRKSSDLSPIEETEAPEEVAPLVQAINDLLARLDQSLRSQKHFLADAAHQLKTPLAGLRTQAELAQREIDSGQGDTEAVKRSLQQIARSSQNAAHMVNQLLAMARADDKEHTSHKQQISLAGLATETVRDFVPKALEKRIDLGYEGPGGSASGNAGRLAVWGDPVLLRELIRNLVDNALQYTPAGGVVTVRVLHDPFGQVVVLQVEDSGPGIPVTEREKVFQPFYRTLGTEVDGSGLGLAIVREIALRHGAELQLEDANLRPRSGPSDHAGAPLGPGVRFTLRFTATPWQRDSGAAGETPAR
jgi:two-component system sensor histidine kinase TctE